MREDPRLCYPLICLLGVLAAAAAHGAPPDVPPVGSVAFAPSPAHPVGFRGDGSGRYPGATPPVTWSRRFADSAMTGSSYQAPRPADPATPGNAVQLDLGIIKDWLVIGPYPCDEPEKDIDKAFLPDESSLQPDAGQKAGNLSWKPLHATIDTQSTHYTNEGTCQDYNVDFVFLYGQSTNQVAYAHTYLFSPTGGEVQLSIHRAGAAAKIWLNGVPTVLNPKDWSDIHKSNITLKRGWNRLLVKLSCAQSTRPEGQNPWISKWRFSAYLSAPLPAKYETKNIAWMTKLPGFSASSPVVAGDRLFATCGTSDLVCIDKRDGRVRWLVTCTPCDAMTEEEKSAPSYKEHVMPLADELAAADRDLVESLNAFNGLHGGPDEQKTNIDARIKQKHELEKKLQDALRSLDRKRFVPMYNNEVSGANGTPCTDGQRVYAALGGGSKGPGAYVIAAYDLDGKHIWSFHESLGAGEHGNHDSPVLVDGKLIYAANTTILALDAATGKPAWRVHLPDAENDPGCKYIPTRLGGQPVLVVYPNQIIRIADGQPLGKGAKDDCYFSSLTTPVIENGWLYVDGDMFKKDFRAVKLPEALEGAPQVAFKLGREKWRLAESSGFSIASAISVGGLYYTLDTMGGLTVMDPATPADVKVLYVRRIEMYQRANRMIFGFTASPTLGGNNLYIFDNTGSALILQPGRGYKEVGRNIIENLVSADWQDYKQELFYASPVFDGASLYLKGAEYLYCIREN